jgi:hypothetical protein
MAAQGPAFPRPGFRLREAESKIRWLTLHCFESAPLKNSQVRMNTGFTGDPPQERTRAHAGSDRRKSGALEAVFGSNWEWNTGRAIEIPSLASGTDKVRPMIPVGLRLRSVAPSGFLRIVGLPTLATLLFYRLKTSELI